MLALRRTIKCACGAALFSAIVAVPYPALAGDDRPPPRGAFTADLALDGWDGARTVIVEVDDEAGDGEPAHALTARFVKLFAQKARLDAERTGARDVIFPVGFETASLFAQTVAESERRVFAAKLAADANQRAQHERRAAQLQKEIDSLRAQQAAKRVELRLIRRELLLVEDLFRKKLANEVRLIGMQREVARFEGEDASLSAQIARVEAQVDEVRLQAESVRNSTVLDAEKDLRGVESELREMIDMRARAESASAASPDFGGRVMRISTRGAEAWARPVSPRTPAAAPAAYKPCLEECAAPAKPAARPRRGAERKRWRSPSRRYASPAHHFTRVARRLIRFRF
ncbi:MAG: hypothetical protein NW215_11480 [Hyphomicrobiales bacterium]|nr:hypothetical protein [Hyphomicrobiales bacterium]